MGLGLVTCDHLTPFQCRSRVLPALLAPTAHALLAEVAATVHRPPGMVNDVSAGGAIAAAERAGPLYAPHTLMLGTGDIDGESG